ncbi:hypothetical protein AB4455_12265 [Vibrio sp. 10N.261.46.E12]|uniref:hypothetical protein n=1 Tax=unclassified Vibrio TaxID=2614977 RepID=UPI0009772CE2|nr:MULTISPECIES: hypothetical protein [unclassified Vibrio]OMO34212.1 hypothetical protein BH584_13415 [Vibrio sp. 10N.261.45.E1]PMJ33138.1 hypothetical protein BCU27_25180 [Vibrio sp. 10N.286.45.B6]PML86371.1 hypothetical protein BCT66_14365 [Vibrio sp. 10N.261.49.E11]PMM77487.1 hypothetical protein BCT48_23805 [Vibrio sp. 10N.261.46.F12]PMM90611.1 hypothetical protein BCT46_03310 [Vibrio sp. 10N.261.46.E8]
MSSSAPKKITVVISEDNAHAVSDWNVIDWYQSLKNGDTAYVATSLMFNELRIGVDRNEIAPFSFEFRGKTIHIGDNGEVVERVWPDGMFDQLSVQVKMLMSRKPREAVEADMKEMKQRARSKS